MATPVRAVCGQRTFRLAGDWGRDDHGGRRGNVGLAEVGVGNNLGPVQLALSLGQTRSKQKQVLNGHVKADGTYLIAKALILGM